MLARPLAWLRSNYSLIGFVLGSGGILFYWPDVGGLLMKPKTKLITRPGALEIEPPWSRVSLVIVPKNQMHR
jgi:hypothetical protein